MKDTRCLTFGNVAGLVLVAVTAAMILGHFHNRFWWPPDDGAYAHVAERIVDGEVLNRDVHDIHMGYINFANALAMNLFGRDLVSPRYPLAIMTFVQACLIYLMLLEKGLLPSIAGGVAMASLSFVQFLNPTAHWYCLFLFVVLLAVLRLPPTSRYRNATCGALVTTIFLFRQLTGVFAVVGVVTFLLLEASTKHATKEKPANGWVARIVLLAFAVVLMTYLARRVNPWGVVYIGVWPLAILMLLIARVSLPNRMTLTLVGQLSCGAALAAIPLCSYHLFHGTISPWLDDTFWSAAHVTELPFVTARALWQVSFQGLRAVLTEPSLAAKLNGTFWFLLPFTPTILGYLVFQQLLLERSTQPRPLPFLATFYALVTLHFQVSIYLFYSLPLIIAGLLTYGGHRRVRQVAVFGIVLATCVVGLYFHAGQPTHRLAFIGQRMPVVYNDAFPKASLWMSEAELATYSRLVRIVETRTDPGATILALPSNSEVYFLTGRRNPFRWFNSTLGLHDAAAVEQACQTLKQSLPSLLIYRPLDKYNLDATQQLMQSLRGHYELIDSFDGFEIYQRTVNPAS